jgi:CopG family nickel-responsive transcriptional regulator
MSGLYRFGIALDKSLITDFDAQIASQGYASRSEAIRDLIRAELTNSKLTKGGYVAGALVMTYDHHKRDLMNTMLDIQHTFQELIISTQHIHLDHTNCLEIIAVKGCSKEIEKLTIALKTLNGVKQVSISMASTPRAEHGKHHTVK